MNKKIAIPTEENGLLCPHFGHCAAFTIFDTENHVITNIYKVNPPEHHPGVYPKWLAEMGVTNVIAGGIGEKAMKLFHQQNIQISAGAQVKTVKDIATDFLNEELELSNNTCNHHEHQCHH